MRDEGFSTAYGILNVPRDANLETVEAMFARLYKAARRHGTARSARQASSDLRRQELNSALEALRDLERRAAVEVESYHLPLDPTAVVPTVEELAGDLLPWDADPPADPVAAAMPPHPQEVVKRLIDSIPQRSWPSDGELLRQLAARVAVERLDPWDVPAAD